eukprot:9124485-Alexandrium_andersonii.AAC.1
MPHSYAFNKVVAVDTIYVDYLSRRVPYLNMVCHGTNFQQVRRLEQPTSEAAWRCFNGSWIAYFGGPEVLLCDGGPEFMKTFADGAEM